MRFDSKVSNQEERQMNVKNCGFRKALKLSVSVIYAVGTQLPEQINSKLRILVQSTFQLKYDKISTLPLKKIILAQVQLSLVCFLAQK